MDVDCAVRRYKCIEGYCFAARGIDAFDSQAMHMVVGHLMQDGVLEKCMPSDDVGTREARAEADRLRHELDEWAAPTSPPGHRKSRKIS
jgi:hypothetical protein